MFLVNHSHTLFLLVVPGSPANIKVLTTSINSLTVSWLPPNKPNGKITGYWVYWRALENGKHKNPDKARLKAHDTHFKIDHLSSSGTYELWVTAITKIGEGESTQVVYATPSSRGKAIQTPFLSDLFNDYSHIIKRIK